MASDSGQARQSQERDLESCPNQWQEGARKSARQGDRFLYVDSQALFGLRKELINRSYPLPFAFSYSIN